jgi:hypothetical protein
MIKPLDVWAVRWIVLQVNRGWRLFEKKIHESYLQNMFLLHYLLALSIIIGYIYAVYFYSLKNLHNFVNIFFVLICILNARPTVRLFRLFYGEM